MLARPRSWPRSLRLGPRGQRSIGCCRVRRRGPRCGDRRTTWSCLFCSPRRLHTWSALLLLLLLFLLDFLVALQEPLTLAPPKRFVHTEASISYARLRLRRIRASPARYLRAWRLFPRREKSLRRLLRSDLGNLRCPLHRPRSRLNVFAHVALPPRRGKSSSEIHIWESSIEEHALVRLLAAHVTYGHGEGCVPCYWARLECGRAGRLHWIAGGEGCRRSGPASAGARGVRRGGEGALVAERGARLVGRDDPPAAPARVAASQGGSRYIASILRCSPR